MRGELRSLISSVPVLLMACLSPALAADTGRLDALELQLRDAQVQLAALKAGPHDKAVLDDLRQSTAKQHDDIRARLSAQPRVGLDNGRLSVTSADGAFSLALRSLMQFDAGYFAQGKNPPGVDLNSGSNLRRARIGLVGTAWRDWAYNFTYEFGGSGVEKAYLYSAYLQYDGLKPLSFRIGAFTPFDNLEGATGGSNITFLERATAASVARGIAGSSGRDAISVFAQGDRYLASVSFTGGRTTDAATFDEQQALVGRIAWLAVSDGGTKWLLNADVAHVFKLADVAPGPASSNTINLGDGPELALQTARTISTGGISASKVTEFGFETALNAGRFYAQGGWFHYGVVRKNSVLPDPRFSGWYTQASWSLTGETRRYESASAAFRALQPDRPLGTPGGFGAFESKLRYSSMNLDYMPTAVFGAGGINGGIQNVWTTGLNWYPTSGLRFMLDLDDIHVHHVEAPAGDISAVAVGLRSQVSF